MLVLFTLSFNADGRLFIPLLLSLEMMTLNGMSNDRYYILVVKSWKRKLKVNLKRENWLRKF